MRFNGALLTAMRNPMGNPQALLPRWRALSCDSGRCDADFIVPAGLEDWMARRCWKHLGEFLRNERLRLIRAGLEAFGDPYASTHAASVVDPVA